MLKNKNGENVKKGKSKTYGISKISNDINKILVIIIVCLFIGTNVPSNLLSEVVKADDTKGHILVYSTAPPGHGYDDSVFDEDLPSILNGYGYSVDVKDKGDTDITEALLATYDELWFISGNWAFTTVLTEEEVNVILEFRNNNNGLLIAADHTDSSCDYTNDADLIANPLNVDFYGTAYVGNDQLVYPDFEEHPLFYGVTSLFGTRSEARMSADNPAEIVGRYQSNNIIAARDDGKGRVVFDTSFVRLWDDVVAMGDAPQYVRNIADWLMGSDLNVGLVGYWNFDEDTGTTAHDSSGYGNDGTIHGASWTTGVSGGALSFDGVDDYIDCGNDNSLNPTNAITLSAWYKPTISWRGRGNDPIIDKGIGIHTPPYYQYHLGVCGDLYPNSNEGFEFDIAGDGGWHLVAYNAWNFGNWYHVVGTYDGNYMMFYVNGNLISSKPVSGLMQNYGRNLLIGKYCDIDTIDHLPGIIDEIRIYNRALCESEIKELHNFYEEEDQNLPPIVSITNINKYSDPEKTIFTQEKLVINGHADDPDGTIKQVQIKTPSGWHEAILHNERGLDQYQEAIGQK